MAFTLTDEYLDTARRLGVIHAKGEIGLDVESASDAPLEDEEDEFWLVWKVTGEKLDRDSEDHDLIIQAYTDSYYETWEDYNGS